MAAEIKIYLSMERYIDRNLFLKCLLKRLVLIEIFNFNINFNVITEIIDDWLLISF